MTKFNTETAKSAGIKAGKTHRQKALERKVSDAKAREAGRELLTRTKPIPLSGDIEPRESQDLAPAPAEAPTNHSLPALVDAALGSVLSKIIHSPSLITTQSAPDLLRALATLQTKVITTKTLEASQDDIEGLRTRLIERIQRTERR